MAIDSPKILQRSWSGKAFLLVDLDAFFASVEQLDHPQWRGKPVIVGGRSDRRGVVSTCSYEARAYGVRSAMASSLAERLCPNAIWVEPNFARYREVSGAVMEIMYSKSPYIEQVSIDEAYLDVSPGKFIDDDPVKLAADIQRHVFELGVTCSIGVASSKIVAKIASDMDKPQGLTVVYPESEASFLAPLEVRLMPGIGKQSAEKLARLGIATLGDLAQVKPTEVQHIFGINTQEMLDKARGIDMRPIIMQRDAKSIGHERTFSTDLNSREEIENAIDMLGSMVGRRLRQKGLSGHTVTLKLRYADLSRRTAQKSFPARVNDEGVFIPIAKALIGEIWKPEDRVRLVGVSISGFDDEERQLGLFEGQEQLQGNSSLITAADEIRDRFGDGALSFGRELKTKIKDTKSRDPGYRR